MADNIVVPLPEPGPEPAGDQTVIVNVAQPEAAPEPEATAAEVAEPVIDHAERLAALEERVLTLEEQLERLALLEAEQDALLEMLEEEWEEPEEPEAVVVEPVPDVPPIPETPPEPVKPGSTRRASWDYFRNRREP